MYALRVAKADWWDVAGRIRVFYQQNHPVLKEARVLARMLAEGAPRDPDGKLTYETRKAIGGAVRTTAEAVKHHRLGWEEETVEVQLFDDGDTWLLRMCDRYGGRGGSLLHGELDRFPELTEVFYDGRVDDVPEDPAERARNHAVTRQVDEWINTDRYLLYPVVTAADLRHLDMTVLNEMCEES